MSEKKTIILVSDYVIAQKGLQLLIEKNEDLLVIGKTGNVAGLFTLLKLEVPDIVIFNLNFPEVSINSICNKLHLIYPQIPILLLINSVTEISIPEAIIEGVRGIIWSENSNDELIKAIHRVSSGGLFFENPDNCKINCRISQKLHRINKQKKTDSSLSIRETEILKLLAEGKTHKEIANFLSISARTVETHKKNMQTKLCIKNKAELIRYAVKNGYLTIL